MRRKPLFPPPISPTTGKRKRNKGKQPYTILTINGRIRWHCCEDGTSTLTDCLLDEAECTVSHGAKELICRLNQSSASFRKTSENLKRAAQLESNDETQSHCHVSVTRGNHEAAGRLMALACLDNSRLWQSYWLTADPATNYRRHEILPDPIACPPEMLDPGLFTRLVLDGLERREMAGSKIAAASSV